MSTFKPGQLKGLLGAVAGVALLVASGTASAQIAGTRHNLGTGGPGPNTFSGTGEVCVFCHTPHGADNSAAVPLWNRDIGTPPAYTTYDSLGTTSLDGNVENVGSVSLACLSCHDGTQAMDTLLNDPGSGDVVASFTGGTWTGNDRPQGIADVGTDLTNDHPVGIQYGGGGQDATTPAGTFKDADFVATQNDAINGTTVWWVDTAAGTGGTREKTDMALYTRVGSQVGADAGGEPFVECASCHDPHTTNTTFLRIENTGSAVCLACHVK